MRIARWMTLACAAALGASAGSAWAGYSAPGYDLQVIQSETGLAHGAISYQQNALMTTTGHDVEVTTTFESTACESIRFARLYLDVWGGSNYKTCAVTAMLNGTSLGTISLGSTSDSNPTYSITGNSVYGSGSGMWQIAFSNIASLLHTDGSPNTLIYAVANTSGPESPFDGRTVCASLVTVYSDSSINQTLDYYLAEADGTIRFTPGTNGSPAERTLTLSGINTNNVASATYIAGYTHGTTGNSSTAKGADQLFFNGTALGNSGNDATLGNTTDYGPNKLVFDVTGLLSQNNVVRYSVAEADVGIYGDTYLRPNIAILAVTHPVPEPGAFAMLAVAGAAAFAMRRRALASGRV